jgi:signal transduction histidine kinase/CheY-like chemotaxis protein
MTSSMASAPTHVLMGGGEMGERMRAMDWSKTPLGPPAGWPQSLCTAVRILLTSRQAMFVWWGDELINLYNDAYKSIVGGKHPEALGQPASWVWREIWDQVRPRAESALRSNEGTYDEALLLVMERHGYPEETYYTFSYSPVPNDQGGTGGILCANTDETQRILAERQLSLLRSLAARTADARTFDEACAQSVASLATNPFDLPFAMIYVTDPERRQASLAGSSGIEWGHAAAPESVSLDGDAPWPLAQVLETQKACLVSDLSPFGALPTGAWDRPPQRAMVLPVTAAGQPGKAGILVAGLNPLRPFDASYRGFLDLMAAQVAAGIRNAQAYEEERKRAEALAELDRAKTTFFSNISHELRTPLTLMLGPLEEILGRPAALSPDDREMLAVARRNGQRLLKLVNSLLDFSRIEAGRVVAAYEPVDLAAYTAELASVFRAAVEKAGMTLALDCDPLPEPVYVDREAWEKIVLNLLSNAFKYTLEGSIRVALHAVDGRAVLAIADTGTGIPAAELPHVFDRFHRVEGARGRTHEGTGIGLALVRELAQLHGGTVGVDSVYGEGSTFTVTLPFGKSHLPAERLAAGRDTAAAPEPRQPGGAFVGEALRWLPQDTGASGDSGAFAAAAPPGRQGREGTAARVMVADDNADMRDYLERLLSTDYEVITAADGEEALEAARGLQPDLLLTDVMMPRLDGFGLLGALRSDPRTETIPVIMLSARAGEEARVEGFGAGADDYLVKPFSARELLARVGGTLALARARREALRREEELKAETESILESINEGFVALGPDYRYSYVNTAAERMFATHRGAMLGRVPWEIFPGLAGSRLEEGFRHGIERRTGVHLEHFYEPWGKWFEIDGYPAKDGGLAIYFRDATERKRTIEELEEAARRKDEFLATLAHELRNPLAPLRNGLEIMRLARQDPEAVEQSRAMMERQLHQMVRLIDDLLDLSRISRGKVELQREPVELAEVVRSAIETSRPVIEQAGHRLAVRLPPEPVIVEVDLTRLAQVFSNLLHNAAKYTDQGHIVLTVERQGREVAIAVEDDGSGIPAAMLPRVFDMFTQIDPAPGKARNGLGIGLSIVKRLVEMHGGRVSAESAGLGLGSRFVVRLPVAGARAADAPEDAPAEEAPPARTRALIADDNLDSAASLAKILELMGNEVRTAHDGLEAVAAAADFRPALILLDIGMPNLNGYEACRRIREQPGGREALIVALTGWGQEEDKRRSQEAGFDQHLVKPLEIASLERLLAAAEARAAAEAPRYAAPSPALT